MTPREYNVRIRAVRLAEEFPEWEFEKCERVAERLVQFAEQEQFERDVLCDLAHIPTCEVAA